MPRRKPISGQVSLIGEVYDFTLKYKPHVEEGVVVLRIPSDASALDRAASMEEVRKMTMKAKPKVTYYRKRGY